VTFTVAGPEVLFETCVAMKFVDDDDDVTFSNKFLIAYNDLHYERHNMETCIVSPKL